MGRAPFVGLVVAAALAVVGAAVLPSRWSAWRTR